MTDPSNKDMILTAVAETENYALLVGTDADGETIYNLELGNITLHLFKEEWEELIELVEQAKED
jgi:hypothetical protein